MMALETIELGPETAHKYSVIWLHGLGADGHDFEAIVPELDLPEAHGIAFIFPNAPVQAVTINGGLEMRSWYDILEMSLERKVDKQGIYQSATLIEQLVVKEMQQGIRPENILLAGFSQGGVVALHTALRMNNKLAGIVALSTYLPTIEELNIEAAKENQTTPIFMAHGVMDSVVDMQAAKMAFSRLKALQYPISWHQYEMDHAVCQQEIQDISCFIRKVFNLELK